MTSTDPLSPTGSAERRIEHATEAIRSMSQNLADEVAPPPTWIARVSAVTREAPLHSLAIAFLIGVLAARR